MIRLDRHHNGPPHSGHGGILAGRLAETLGSSAGVVRFNAPIPLETDLAVDRIDAASACARLGNMDIATARRLDTPVVIAPFAPADEQQLAAAERRWITDAGRHPSPTCFGCGPDRGDGLDLRPGRLPNGDGHASRWHVDDGSIPSWMIWAALDCAGAGPVLAEHATNATAVTGELAVEIYRPISGSRSVQVRSRLVGRDGPKRHVETAMLDDRSDPIAVSTATWFVIPIPAASTERKELLV